MNQFLSTERFQEKDVLNSMHDHFNVSKNDSYIRPKPNVHKTFIWRFGRCISVS